MARIQPVLTASENALVDQMAALTRTKRSDVIKNALAGAKSEGNAGQIARG